MKDSRVKNIIFENKINFILLTFFIVTVNVLTLVTPLIIGFVTDELLVGSTKELSSIGNILVSIFGGLDYIKDNVWVVIIPMVIVAALIGFFNYLKGKMAAKISENVARKIRDELFEHLLNLPYSYFNKINTGDVIQRCTSDIDNIRLFLNNHLVEIIRTVTLVAVALTYMLNFNVKLSFYSTFLLPVSFVFGIVFMKFINKVVVNFEEKEADVNTVIQENVSAVRVVKAFNNETFEISKFEVINQKFNMALRELLKGYAVFWSVSDLLCFAQYALAIGAGAYYGYHGLITAGEYVIFVSYAAMLIWPVRMLGRIFAESTKTKVAYERIVELFEIEEEVDLTVGDEPSVDGDIEFTDFSFKFDDEDDYTLKDINLKINKGETVGILGSIGSGKSTLMHMLLRLHEYDTGSITINGHELKTINKKYLRKKVGISLQDNFLYGKTIIENLKLANQDISDEEVYDVATVANIHSTFSNFKDGYNTQIGEKGVTLSGGQKQRATIARTLIKNTNVLIFDDSLSAVDPETDAKIREQLKDVSSNITTIIIAQRINTIMDCDKIVVMDKGRITHIGTHDELISIDGIYKSVWDIQNMQTES